MREVIISIHCDACQHELAEHEVDVVKVTVVNGSTYEADFCYECLMKFLKPTRETKPVRKNAKPGTTGTHACSRCDKRFSKPAGLTRHMNQTHAL